MTSPVVGESLRQIDYRGLCAWEARGPACAATIVPELGGRIMSFRALPPDGVAVELLWQADDPISLKVGSGSGVIDLPALRRALGPLHYGGHKTWLSPQRAWGEGRWPFLDLDNGTYTVTVDAAINVLSPVCRETGMQLARSVSSDETGVRVVERLLNRGHEEATFGLWSVTQVVGRGRVTFPVGDRPVLRLDGPAASQDGLHVENGVASLACDHRAASKHGTPHAGGWVEAAGASGAWVLRKEYHSLGEGDWPHGCAVEVYDFGPGDRDCFEVELLTPVVTLQPEESIGFTERWSVRFADGQRTS